MKRSTNKYDVFTWIKKVINSCENQDQLLTANRLGRLFYKQHKDIILASDLDGELSRKQDEFLIKYRP